MKSGTRSMGRSGSDEQRESYTNTTRERVVRCETAEQPDHVGQKPENIRERGGVILLASDEVERSDQPEPNQQYAEGHPDCDFPPHWHTSEGSVVNDPLADRTGAA